MTGLCNGAKQVGCRIRVNQVKSRGVATVQVRPASSRTRYFAVLLSNPRDLRSQRGIGAVLKKLSRGGHSTI